MSLTRSLTSGLTMRLRDPAGVFWGIGDRGPNIKPSDAVALYGLTDLLALAHIDGAKIMPVPDEGPCLARFRLTGDAVELEMVVPLRAPDGTTLSGLPPLPGPGMEYEPVFALTGAPLTNNAPGADTEGIAALPDGRFCISEEYGPSLLIVTEQGIVERRIVPEGTASLFASSTVPIVEGLPSIAGARKLNRGFEALTLSADGGTLFAAFQSPLAHPDRAAHETGDIVRLWALEPGTGACLAEYAYPLDAPGTFTRDAAVAPVALSDIKVAELAALTDGSLLVLERVTLSTHIYRIRLHGGSALPNCFVDCDHRPTLEQLGQHGARAEGVPLLQKELVFSTDQHPEICGDLEGMLILGDGGLLLANDSDYGIGGSATQFWKVPLLLVGAEI